MSSLVTTQSHALERTTETEALVREQFGLQEATSMEIEYLFTVAQRLGLDPVSKQIYGIMRWDARARRKKLTVQVGIDGLRLAAARTNGYAGCDDAVFTGTTPDGYPDKATITVYSIVQGHRVPWTASARWNEYVQKNKDGKPSGQWPTMPHVMLAKCAEALALRKAFPAELGGVYTDAELQHADEVVEVAGLTDEQADTLTQLSKDAGVSDAVAKARIENMKPSEYQRAVETLQQRIAEQASIEDATIVEEAS